VFLTVLFPENRRIFEFLVVLLRIRGKTLKKPSQELRDNTDDISMAIPITNQAKKGIIIVRHLSSAKTPYLPGSGSGHKPGLLSFGGYSFYSFLIKIFLCY
jgi:hypothetical protein